MVRQREMLDGIESKKINNIKGLYKQIESVLLIKTKPLFLSFYFSHKEKILELHNVYIYY